MELIGNNEIKFGTIKIIEGKAGFLKINVEIMPRKKQEP